MVPIFSIHIKIYSETIATSHPESDSQLLAIALAPSSCPAFFSVVSAEYLENSVQFLTKLSSIFEKLSSKNAKTQFFRNVKSVKIASSVQKTSLFVTVLHPHLAHSCALQTMAEETLSFGYQDCFCGSCLLVGLLQ